MATLQHDLKIFHICKNRKFDIVSRILLEASKIATDLYVIKSSACKGWFSYKHFCDNSKNFKLLIHWQFCQSCHLFFLWWSTKCQNQTKMSRNISAYLLNPFIKSTSLYPSYIKQYFGIQKLSVHNEKWCLQLHNLLFPEWCWFQKCDLVWNTLKQGSTHNPHCTLDI
jgi:hypothetical protein